MMHDWIARAHGDSRPSVAARWPIAGLLAALILAGCSRGEPHGVAERYIEYLQQFNYPATYHLLSAQDRKDRSLREFLTEIPLAPDVSPIWFRPILHKMHYELGPERRNADGVTASVPVRITMPDLPLWERTLDAAAGPDDTGADRAQRSLDIGDYPKVTYDDMFFLLKEHHHWRVVAGFAARDPIVDQHRQAIVQYHEHDFDGALATYKSMISDLEKQPATGSRSLAQRYQSEMAAIENVRKQQAVTAAYMPRLKLDRVSVKMSEERVPAIFGTIINTGDKPLDEVALAVTWYQGRGRSLQEVHREIHPIVATPLQFTDFSRSVLPFTPGEMRDFGFILSAPAQVEQDASPYVTVSSIAFTQSSAPLPAAQGANAGGVGAPSLARSSATAPDSRNAPPSSPQQLSRPAPSSDQPPS
jgi:hypothetical protein